MGWLNRRGGGEEEFHTLWRMLYADVAGFVSRSPGGLERIGTVIVTARASFGLTVMEAKTNIMCLQTNDEKVLFNGTAADEVYTVKGEFVYLGGVVSANRDLRSI